MKFYCRKTCTACNNIAHKQLKNMYYELRKKTRPKGGITLHPASYLPLHIQNLDFEWSESCISLLSLFDRFHVVYSLLKVINLIQGNFFFNENFLKEITPNIENSGIPLANRSFYRAALKINIRMQRFNIRSCFQIYYISS